MSFGGNREAARLAGVPVNLVEVMVYVLMGLVTALHDDPLAAAMEAAAGIRERSPDAIRATKRLVNSAWRLTDTDALALEAELQLGVLGKKNQLEAVMANVQKRVPDFDD